MHSALTCIGSQGARRRDELASWLSGARRERVLDDSLHWIKRLRLVTYEGRTMRQRFRYGDASLWWFTELFLHKERRLEHALATVAALAAAQEECSPARIELETSSAIVRAAAESFSRAHGVPISFTGSVAHPTDDRWSSYLIGLSASLSRLRPAAAARRRGRARVAAFVHTAFWRSGTTDAGDVSAESYVGPILEALRSRVSGDGLACVGVGPRRNFRARRWWDPVVAAPAAAPAVIPIEQLAPRDRLTGARDLWRRRQALARAITAGQAIRDAAVVNGCDLWGVLAPELERAARLQWPWSARAMDEAGAAIDALEPDAVLTYAEAGGWGRALVLEARRRRVPSVGVQHGFIYRHWLNYRHETDEIEPDGADAGFPRPDCTLVYDRYAADYLAQAGHFPDGALRVTGSAKLDRLASDVRRLRTAARDAIRREFGAGTTEALLVLAAKFSEIHEELPALYAAVSTMPSLRLVIKPHPAETDALYAPGVAGHPSITIASARSDLARLLAAADGLITMNSTVAIDALSLDVPALVLGLPNNLTPFVTAGVMLGADRSCVGEQVRRLLYDQRARLELRERGAAFVERFQMRPDGHATERGVDEILGLMARHR